MGESNSAGTRTGSNFSAVATCDEALIDRAWIAATGWTNALGNHRLRCRRRRRVRRFSTPRSSSTSAGTGTTGASSAGTAAVVSAGTVLAASAAAGNSSRGASATGCVGTSSSATVISASPVDSETPGAAATAAAIDSSGSISASGSTQLRRTQLGGVSVSGGDSISSCSANAAIRTVAPSAAEAIEANQRTRGMSRRMAGPQRRLRRRIDAERSERTLVAEKRRHGRASHG